jgi:hypothetical protein
VVATVVIRQVRVVHGAVVAVVRVPPREDAVGVVTVDVRSRAPATPMSHLHTVETKPLRRHVRAYHVAWTTPSDDNCRRAVDGT